uniref:RanBP2-type domain-containing protein n=1 Tax=Zosterops lateralis melanops TaxID=1220523 RepID=A0A8D2PAQ1_ZOSLA
MSFPPWQWGWRIAPQSQIPIPDPKPQSHISHISFPACRWLWRTRHPRPPSPCGCSPKAQSQIPIPISNPNSKSVSHHSQHAISHISYPTHQIPIPYPKSQLQCPNPSISHHSQCAIFLIPNPSIFHHSQHAISYIPYPKSQFPIPNPTFPINHSQHGSGCGGPHPNFPKPLTPIPNSNPQIPKPQIPNPIFLPTFPSLSVVVEHAASSAITILGVQPQIPHPNPKFPIPYFVPSLSVVVEDAASSAAITLRVQPHITIGTLKEQVFRELGFPALAQRWIIGQSLCRDGRSLSSYGIRGDGDTAFLFLLTATAAGLGRQQQAQSLLRAAGLGDASPGWPCPRCTFLNKPTRPGCEMCSSPRPEGYRVPGGHRPDPAEQQRLQREQDGTRQCQQVWS